MRIPYLDLSVKDSTLKRELLRAVDRVLSHGRIILGPEVDQFEKRVAEFCQKRYVVGVNSGTDALYLALRSLNVGPGEWEWFFKESGYTGDYAYGFYA